LHYAKKRFEEQGITLAAISYDNQGILKDFGQRLSISYPLLADPDSAIIKRYSALNEKATGLSKGMAVPGFVYIDKSGLVKESVFDAEYTNRYTGNSIIAKIFPELIEAKPREVQAEHINLSLQQSDRVANPGSRITLTTLIKLLPDVHVYAPEVKGYKPIALEIEGQPEIKLNPVVYPQSRILHLKAIKESVPVYEGKFRVTQDVTIAADRAFIKSLPSSGKTVTVKGVFKYQACDETTCYMPAQIPVIWEIQVLPLDFQRAPEAIQHKDGGK
jgi:hypothetical protein